MVYKFIRKFATFLQKVPIIDSHKKCEEQQNMVNLYESCVKILLFLKIKAQALFTSIWTNY